jgi:hypothetical protein
MTKIRTITKLVGACALMACGLSGCEILSDPAFLQAMQDGSQQIVNNGQSQQRFNQCMQTAASNRQSGSDCVGSLTQDLSSQFQSP